MPPADGGVAVVVVVEVEGFVLRGEAAAFEDGERILDAEAAGVLEAVLFGDNVAGFLHLGWAVGEVVSVGGEEVDPPVGEELVGEALGGLAQVAKDGAGGDLVENAGAEPVDEA